MSVQQTELQLDVLLATYWGTSTDEEITRLWRLNRTNLTLISTNFVSRDKWILKHEMPAVSLKWHLRGDLLRSGYAAGPASGWSLKALSSKQKSSVCVDVQSFACCRDSHVWDMLALAYNKWCTQCCWECQTDGRQLWMLDVHKCGPCLEIPRNSCNLWVKAYLRKLYSDSACEIMFRNLGF